MHTSTGTYPVLYITRCVANYLVPYLGSTINSNIKLWIADYPATAGNPLGYTGCGQQWNTWTWSFHQYFAPSNSNVGNNPSTGMDQDFFNGTQTDFNSLVGGGSASTSCGVPTGLFSTNVTQNSATLVWNSVPSATSYSVEYKAVGSSTWSNPYTASNAFFTFSGVFACNTQFQWKVLANCSSGSSAFSSEGTFTTSSCSNSCTPPVVPQFSATSICSGNSVHIANVSNYTNCYYTWTLPSGAPSNGFATDYLTSAQSGVYSVTVTDNATGCSSSNSATVMVYETPTVSITPQNPTVCAGQALVLQAAGGSADYIWSDGTQSPTDTVYPTSSTSYMVTASNGSCSATTYTSPLVYASNASITPNAPTINAGGSVTLTTGGGATYQTYQWSTGAISSSITVSPTQTTTYTVTATNTGCSATSSVTVYVSQPGCTFSVFPFTINTDSNGISQPITVTTGNSCSWSVSGGCTGITVQPTSGTGSGSFTVSIAPNNDTITHNCSLTVDAYTIQITQTGRRGSGEGSTCQPIDTSVIVNDCDLAAQVITNASYEWFRNGTSVNITRFCTVTQSGYYYCKITVGACIYYTNLNKYFTCSTTGIIDIERSSIVIYPNPANDYITITGLKIGSVIRITNVIGEVIYAAKTTSETQTIPIANWASGMYFLNNRKFVKE